MDFRNALCVKDGGDYWLSENASDQARARRLCTHCPIMVECAIYALEIKPSCGVWAGRSIGGYVC